MTSDLAVRREQGEVFRAMFNELLDETVTENASEALSYRDMSRICDILRAESERIFKKKFLPRIIDRGLSEAVDMVDPNKQRSRTNRSKFMSLFGCATGASLIVIFLGQLVSPGIIAAIVAFFVGGFASGIVAPIGIIVGIALVVMSIYKASQKISYKERYVIVHKIVMKAVDMWIKYGDDEISVRIGDSDQKIYIENK